MKLLRNAILFICVLAIAFVSVSPAFAEETGDKTLNTRKDFVWGINMHSNFYSAYGNDKLEEQVHLAAELGCKILRNNFNVNDLDYVDTFVQLCNAYGIQVMLTVDGNIKSGGDAARQEDYDLFKMVANRYNGQNGHGKIDYIQLNNELDVFFSQRVASYGGYFGNGDSISNYPADDLEMVCNNLKNASAGVRAAKTDVRIVINAGWEHYGMFSYFKSHDLDYDIIGWDWYGDQAASYIGRGNTAFGIYNTLDEMFHKPIMICETNIWNNSAPDENNPSTWDMLVKICEDAYSKPNVIGCIVYEMCDELYFETGSTYNREAHFGFIYSDKYGNMLGKKAAYDRFQYIWGGVSQPRVTIDSLRSSAGDTENDEPISTGETEVVPASPIPHDDTPFDGSAFSQDEDEVNLEETLPVAEMPENPAAQKPTRKYHKGSSSKGFVWTLENTLTVVVGAVTAAVLAVFAVLYIRMRKKIKFISVS